MWRRAEGDPNNYLVLGKNIMDRNQAGRMTVELVNDEDIDGPGKIINVLHDIFYPIINFSQYNWIDEKIILLDLLH